MKLLISFLLFGFVAVVKSDEWVIEEQNTLIKNLNSIRGGIAEKFQIVNMQKLIWSKQLQYEAEQLKKQPSRHYILLNNFDDKNYKVSDAKRRVNDSNIGTLEYLNPQQNETACARNSKLPGNFTVICLFGPQNSLSEIKKYQSGHPKCTGELKPVIEWHDQHLCSSLDSTDPWIVMYISRLNDKREIVAKTQGIANMQNLVWNKELHQVALKFIIGKSPTDTPILPKDRKWRMTGFAKFSLGLDYKPKSNRVISIKTEDGKEETFRLDEEQFNPLQNQIACVLKRKFRDETDEIYWCLLGPEASDAGISPPPTTTQAPLDAQVTTPPTVTTVASSATSRPILTRYTTEKLTPEPPATLPKELEEYEEEDGDEYDEDFPTGKPYHYDF